LQNKTALGFPGTCFSSPVALFYNKIKSDFFYESTDSNNKALGCVMKTTICCLSFHTIRDLTLIEIAVNLNGEPFEESSSQEQDYMGTVVVSFRR
jgi:hypothetical protein